MQRQALPMLTAGPLLRGLQAGLQEGAGNETGITAF